MIVSERGDNFEKEEEASSGFHSGIHWTTTTTFSLLIPSDIVVSRIAAMSDKAGADAGS